MPRAPLFPVLLAILIALTAMAPRVAADDGADETDQTHESEKSHESEETGGTAVEAHAREIARLEAAVRADREQLVALVARERDPSAGPLYDDPQLRAIAERLPALEDALARLAAADAPG